MARAYAGWPSALITRGRSSGCAEEFTMTIGDTNCAEEGAHEEGPGALNAAILFWKNDTCSGDPNCNGHIPWSGFTRLVSRRSHDDAPACS
jgi:hypothetical protein